MLLEISTRAASSCDGTTATGLPDWMSSVSSERSRFSVRTIAWNDGQSRAALPLPAVHDQLLRPLGHLRRDVVEQAAQRALLLPAEALEVAPVAPSGTAGGATVASEACIHGSMYPCIRRRQDARAVASASTRNLIVSTRAAPGQR